MMLAVPLLFLFESSLIIMRFTEKSEARRKLAEAAEAIAADPAA